MFMKNVFKLVCGYRLTCLLLLHPSMSTGEEANTPRVGELAEVIVTAQRREESLQTVPVAVTALTADQLERRQVVDVKAVATAAPGLTIQSFVSDTQSIAIGIRGIAAQNTFLGQDPPVGLYLDGVYIARAAGNNLALVDMERVEVLRGPQGTLFGRNTVGGALNITSKKPENKLEASLDAEVGNYATRNVTAILNVPIAGDVLAARLVYAHREHSGFGRSSVTGGDLSDEDLDYVRGSLRVAPSDAWNLIVSYDWAQQNGNAQLSKLLYFSPTATLPGAPLPLNNLIPIVNGHPTDQLSNYEGGDLYTNNAEYVPRTHFDNRGVTASLTATLGPATVKSITAYRKLFEDLPQDVDATPYPFLEVTQQPVRDHTFSEELQVFGDSFDRRLSWIGGLYYFNEGGLELATVRALYPLAAPGMNPADGSNQEIADNSSYAGFAQVGYKLLPKLRLTAGVRYTHDERSMIYSSYNTDTVTGIPTCALPVPPAAVLPGYDPSLPGYAGCASRTPRANFHSWPWTAGLDYNVTDDVLVYTKVSRGFRSGGFPNAGSTDAGGYAPFAQETLTNYEVGEKADLFDRRFRVNVSAFYADYDNIQTTVQVNGLAGPFNTVQNLGTGQLYGGEIELTALLGDLELSASMGVADTLYTKGPVSGLSFQFAPKTTVGAGADYPLRLPLGTLDLHADYSWRSAMFYQIPPAFDPVIAAATVQKGYGLLNSQISFELQSVPLTISIWGRNLTDEKYISSSLSPSQGALGIVAGFPGDPRTFGVSLRYEFSR
jgi:iron complex outermembrane recepter protein